MAHVFTRDTNLIFAQEDTTVNVEERSIPESGWFRGMDPNRFIRSFRTSKYYQLYTISRKWTNRRRCFQQDQISQDPPNQVFQ